MFVTLAGSDIMMQLDDVVSSTVTGPRVEEAMHRSIRWLDRCIAANRNPHKQNLFAIIQGGLNAGLRKTCLDGTRCFSLVRSEIDPFYECTLTLTPERTCTIHTGSLKSRFKLRTSEL